MQNKKQIIIVGVSALLLGAVIFLTYILTSDSSSIGLFNLRASNPQDEVDAFLSENNLAPTSLPSEDDEESLLAYNSTSPSPSPTGAGTRTVVSGTPTPTPFEANQGVDETPLTPTGTGTKGGLTTTITPTKSLTPTPTEFLEITGENMSPTVVTELPVAGIGDNLAPVLIGGGALILLAFLL